VGVGRPGSLRGSGFKNQGSCVCLGGPAAPYAARMRRAFGLENEHKRTNTATAEMLMRPARRSISRGHGAVPHYYRRGPRPRAAGRGPHAARLMVALMALEARPPLSGRH
jgi:hypothetical protein